MMSRSPLWAYVLKMLVVTAIGMGANWLGIIMAGGLRSGFSEVCVPSDCVKYIDPAKNQGVTDYDTLSTSRLLDAIVFQMGYTLFLAAMAVIVTPLKAAIQWRDEHPREKAPPWFSLVMLFYTACLMTQWGLFIWATDLPSKVWYSASGNTIVASVMFLVAIVCYFPISHGRGGQSMIGWLVLLMIYLPRIFAKMNFKPSQWSNLYLFGLVVMRWPLLGTDRIKKTVQAYGFFFFALLALMREPDQKGRCDLYPPVEWYERLRFSYGEYGLLLAFTVGALYAADPYRITAILNWWSLYAFCFHRMWYHAVPIPYGAVITYACAPLFLIIGYCCGPAAAKPENSRTVLCAVDNCCEWSRTVSKGSERRTRSSRAGKMYDGTSSATLPSKKIVVNEADLVALVDLMKDNKGAIGAAGLTLAAAIQSAPAHVSGPDDEDGDSEQSSPRILGPASALWRSL